MTPGQVFWCVESWGIPLKFVVDFVNTKLRLIRGVSNRGAFVLVDIREAFETLDQAEFHRGKRSFVRIGSGVTR